MTNALSLQLDQLEHQFNQVSAALASGDTAQIAVASATLQVLAVGLLRLAGSEHPLHLAPRSDKERLKALSAGMGVLRDNLSRRAAYVNQALKIVMPLMPQEDTYSSTTNPFGGVVPQSGQFKVLSA